MADIAITAANVLGSTTAVRSTQYKSGEAITAGQVVYLNTSNQWIKLDLNAAATGNGITDVRGIAENSAPASGQPLSVVTYDTDFTVGGALTNGSALYGSTTAGGITHDVPTTGSYPVYVGQAKSAAKAVINFNASGAVI